jgi:hypothetical protein
MMTTVSRVGPSAVYRLYVRGASECLVLKKQSALS